MDKSFFKGLILGLFITLILSTFVSWWFCYETYVKSLPTITEDATEDEKLELLKAYIDVYYNGEIDESKLSEGTYSGLVDALGDPYSVYYSKEDADALAESTSGKFVGIGSYVTLNEDKTYPMISKPMEGSPAMEAGLKEGDVIVEIDGESCYDSDLDSAVSKIKGEEGTTVELTVYREGEPEYLKFSIVRRSIEVQTVEEKMLDGKIGYVSVSGFDEVTIKQFDKAIDTLTDEGMENLIIDLRGNPGGVLTTATAMLDRVLPEKKLLVYMEDKNGKKEEYFSRDKDEVNVPIYILMNSSSASASEVFAGCLRDYDKATIVGTTSFGKGIVQTLFNLGDGSKIKLTTAYYYSPNGINIHGSGIEPDVSVEQDYTTEEDEQLDAVLSLINKQ